jgi:hypothetical protein
MWRFDFKARQSSELLHSGRQVARLQCFRSFAIKYEGHLQFTGPSILRTKLVSMPASASGHPRSRGRLPLSTLNIRLGETGLCLLVRGLMSVLACCPQRTCSMCRNDRDRRAVPTASEAWWQSQAAPPQLQLRVACARSPCCLVGGPRVGGVSRNRGARRSGHWHWQDPCSQEANTAGCVC